MRPRHGFTLIELLVVVAIIVALLAILMPSINKAVAAAHQAVCASNLRQMAIGHSGYLADHRGIDMPSETDGTITHWLTKLAQYAPVDEVRYCPSTDGQRPNITLVPPNQYWGSARYDWNFNTNTYGVSTNEWKRGSYGGNFYTHSTTGWGENINLHFKSMAEAAGASTIPVYSDSVWHGQFPKDTDTSLVSEADGSQPPGGQMTRVLIRRHGKAINVAFYDTSVRLVPLPQMWSLTWHKGFQVTHDVYIPWLQ